MKKKSLFILPLIAHGTLHALPIAGVDFDDGFGGNSEAPDDLNGGDSVAVSAGWTFVGTGGIPFDVNSNTGRASAPVGKFNGPTVSGTPPAVGAAPPTDGVHSFTISIGDDPLTLTKVSFDFSKATGGANVRWIAFRTSLDTNIIYSLVGPARPAMESAEIDLIGAQYSSLANTDVEFFWYSGGEGSGDMDIDSIVIEGESPTDTDADGLADSFEQLIIADDPGDAIATLADVLPGDDYDVDLSTNLEEFTRGTNPVNPDSDNDGLVDGVETNDDTFDDIATDTGTDPLDDDSDDDGIKDGVETNDGTLDDVATDTGTDPNNADTDSDLIPDGFEVNNSLDPFTDDAGDDPDSDDSTNLEEFLAGTLLDNPDTDGDGYRDGIETNDNSFDDIDADTGTDPLDADSDDDGLLDGVETNHGTFISASDTGSSPLSDNTDGDNFRDGGEVKYHGTDPSDAGSFPIVEEDLLFIEANGGGINGADEVAVRLLEDKFGIVGRITVAAASSINTGDELAYDLLVISSTPGSGDMRSKFIDSVIPIVNWEEALIDNAAGEFGATTAVHAKSNQTTEIILADHPIRGSLPETVTLYNGATGETSCSNFPFDPAFVVGTAANGIATAGLAAEIGNDVTGYGMLFAIDTGDAVDPGTTTAGGVAPARRVMLPFTDNTLATLSDDGLTLFSNAIDWALGNSGGPVPLTILDISMDFDSQPGNAIATLEFTSRAGRTYAILTSTDLASLAAGGGDELDDSVLGEEGSTTVNINYNVFGVPLDSARRFFVVREVGGD